MALLMLMLSAALLLFLGTTQTLAATVTPGNTIYFTRPGYPKTCSVGPPFKWQSNGKLGFITCRLPLNSTIKIAAGGSTVGTVVANGPNGTSSYSLVELTDKVELTPGVHLANGSTQTLKMSGKATLGQKVARAGGATRIGNGKVTALNETRDLAADDGGDITITNMIKTDICAEEGDDGGPLYDAQKYLGVLIDYAFDCRTSTTPKSYYTKIDVILNRHKLKLYTG